MKTITKFSFSCLIATILFAESVVAQTISTIETLTLSPNSYWDGSLTPLGTTFTSGNAIFPNYYDTTWGGYWASGWAYSNKTDSTGPGDTNKFSAKTAIGYAGSSNYAIGQQGAVIRLTGGGAGKVVNGFYITNGTYAYESMENGDAFAKKFGGATGNDPDWFKLVVKKWMGGIMTNDSVEFYLADFRFSNNSQDYIVKTWQWVDLTSLGNVDSLLFTLSSSDVGAWGMNTPAFFCIDNFTTADSPAGIAGNQNKQEIINIFPNPAKNFISLQFPFGFTNNITITLFDNSGRVAFTEIVNNNNQRISIAHLNAGIYIVRVDGDDFTETKKIIIKE